MIMNKEERDSQYIYTASNNKMNEAEVGRLNEGQTE